jgi:hypothetical protein
MFGDRFARCFGDPIRVVAWGVRGGTEVVGGCVMTGRVAGARVVGGVVIRRVIAGGVLRRREFVV